MGWFLSSSKKTKKKKKAGRGTGGSEWDPKRTLLGVKFAGVIGAVVLLAVGWGFMERGLVAYANTQHARPVVADDIAFRETPQWLTPAEINHMRTEIAELIGPGPMQRDGLKAAADWLRAQPHIVKELRQVHRTPQGVIVIDADFRQPAAVLRMFNRGAWVDAEDGHHVIDDAGYRLYGPVPLADVDHLGLPLILGVDSSYRPRDEQGEFQFQGNEVPAALALIEALKGEPVLGVIESISVNSRDKKERIRLVLTVAVRPPGAVEPVACTIVWGLPPGHPDAIVEAEVRTKITALNALVTLDAFRMGLHPESWINTGAVQFPQAIAP
ncbi:hypothetical protein OT109_08590 [Phycisphaeraceae bacterium D3-23]